MSRRRPSKLNSGHDDDDDDDDEDDDDDDDGASETDDADGVSEMEPETDFSANALPSVAGEPDSVQPEAEHSSLPWAMSDILAAIKKVQVQARGRAELEHLGRGTLPIAPVIPDFAAMHVILFL